MWSQPVVTRHQVVANIPLCFAKRGVAGGWYPFRLQASEKPLHGRIVPAVTPSAHALSHAIAPQPLPEFPAGILAALIRMKHHILRLNHTGFYGGHFV